ncbi:Transcription factor lepE [Hyphodiscus hymeniophilus]|uniref:Transcription factor lepE n=1 Tax=Hyphodiscus hymeniophilus TaxID=353542 RepID=A0A9P7AVG4_9HELO|nr:Transcription factor lepE [Hyphodiscus hymeniophilus]
MKEYIDFWSKPQTEMDYTSFSIKLLPVLAIGTVFWHGPDGAALRRTARQWVFSAQQWLSAPLEKSRMNLSGLQIQCLLILAREALGVGSDLIWISTGTVLRTAMQLGYNRDPKHFPGISVLHAEMRRRLWATIVEMVMQASFHIAMPPLISMNDWDTEPPANVNDIDIGRESGLPIVSKPLTTFTQTSVQILVRRSLKTRIEIFQASNNLNSEISYDEALRLDAELRKSCRELTSYTSAVSAQQFSSFGRNHLEVILRRPLITLHRPWAIKARTDPRFYFSRKILLETCLEELSSLPSSDYRSILLIGSGIWRDDAATPAMNIALELITQIEEQDMNLSSDIQRIRSKIAREPLIQELRDAVALTKERFHLDEEVNVKCCYIMALFLAQVEAMENGEDVEVAITKVAKQSLMESYEALKARNPDPEKDVSQGNIPGWDEDTVRPIDDGFSYDFAQDLAFDFDFSDAALEDWEAPSWL